MTQIFDKELFANKTVVVTGGTSGIGAATAKYFAELGAKVYAVGINAAALEIPAGLDIQAVELNVLDKDGIDTFLSKLDKIDVLFNGAGINKLNQYDFDVYSQIIDINMNSVFYFSTKAYPLLAKAENASIINVSSMLAIFGSDIGPAYSASKGGIDQITKSLAIQYAKDGIRVNAVAPGWINTPIVGALDQQMIDGILARTPMDRLGEPIEIAKAAVFLASPAASFVTGAILPVDGAYSVI